MVKSAGDPKEDYEIVARAAARVFGPRQLQKEQDIELRRLRMVRDNTAKTMRSRGATYYEIAMALHICYATARKIAPNARGKMP